MSATEVIIPIGVRKERADRVLARLLPEHSRTAIQRALEAGLVLRGTETLTKKSALSAGEAIWFSLPETIPTELRAVKLPLEIIFEDKHIVVVNKTAGMTVHPGAGTGEDTLVHALLAHCKGSLSGIGGVERPGIVHRIDRETSGLMVVAKNDAAHRSLAEAFAARTVIKEYLALVAGVPHLASGTIQKPIARHPKQRHRMAVVRAGGRDAWTDWAIEKTFSEAAALLRCRIHTGRTHQIRVHLTSIGHPLLGDTIYGWRASKPLRDVAIPRVMLHAEHLVITHPVSGKTLDLKAPPPADFRRLSKTLAALSKP